MQFLPLLTLTLATSTCFTQMETVEGPRLLVLNKAEDTLSIIDPKSGATLATVPTGTGPHEVAVSPDGRTAFVSNYGNQQHGHTLSVIDLVAAKEQRRADVAPLLRPHGLAVVEGKVYFTAGMNRVVARYDPDANQLDRVVGLGQDGTHMLVLSPDGRLIFTANIGSDTVTIIDRQTGKIEHVAVGAEPEGIDVSPDGQEVWVGHRVGGLVTVIDVASRKVKGTLQIGEVAIRVKLTRDGKLALVTDPGTGALVVIDAAARKELKRIDLGQQPVGILVPPEGDLVYVAVAGENRVAIVDVKALKVRGSIATGQGPDGLGWAVPTA